MSLRRLLLHASTMIVGAFFLASTARAQDAEIIRGRVTGPDNLPIQNATVTVTGIASNIAKPTRTDKDGKWTVTFPNGEGDYIVAIQALGYAPQRFQAKRIADQDFIVADRKLAQQAAVLGPVRSTATRPPPPRTDNTLGMDALGGDRYLGGDLSVIGGMPGVSFIPGADGAANGFSVFGLEVDQNIFTLNGLAVNGSSIPLGSAVNSSLTTSTYDVARGGFGGGQVSVRTRSGTNYVTRATNMNLDAPQLQWTDRTGSLTGQQYSNVNAGANFSGPIKFNKLFYSANVGMQRRANDLRTLLNTDPAGLEAAGFSSDSVDRTLGILDGLGIPSRVGVVPRSSSTRSGSVLANIDWAPPTSSTGTAFNLTANASVRRTTPGISGLGSGVGVAEVPAHGQEAGGWDGALMGRHTTYLRLFVLSETQLGVSRSSSSASPYLDLPNASVRFTSTLDDGTAPVRIVQFGGGSSRNSNAITTASFSNQLSWFSKNSKHRLKFNTELRYDVNDVKVSTNQLGTFSYNSLADLQAGNPSSFTRQLTPRDRRYQQIVGGMSLGDSYRRNPDFQMQYGVRVDGNRYLTTPAANPIVAQTFGAPNDHAPNRFYLSPRFGFSRTYGKAKQIQSLEGAFTGPRATVRGGIGVFQSGPQQSLLSQPIDQTGLASAAQQVNCVGIATPAANWTAFMNDPASIPTACADGTQGTVFASSVPNVALVNRDYVNPRSVRSNLAWNGGVLDSRFSLGVDGTLSWNVNQPGSVDLNFNPTQRFTLANEAGRPVFVQASSIVPATGAIAARDARISPLFARVIETRSDLQSFASQVSFSLYPYNYNSKWSWGLSYTLADRRDFYRGTTSTAGNPLERQWGPASGVSRHSVNYSLSYNIQGVLYVTWSQSFNSGRPYTAVVGGDVNGDGYGGNDRAFVFDPATTADATLRAGMESLLANGSASARECLKSSLGKIAARNGCVAPWTTGAGMSFSINPIKMHLPPRAQLSFRLNNPLGAADMLLHGEDKLHGWGQSYSPENTLLYVRGFDPGTQQYKYEVNHRFGATSTTQTINRNPVTLTAMLRLDVGPSRERQRLMQYLWRGRTLPGTKYPEASLKSMAGQGSIYNPMTEMLRQADSLHLTREQADSIAAMNRRYTAKVDSIWAPVGAYLVALPDRFDEDEAWTRVKFAREQTVDYLATIVPKVRALVTAAQIRKLPSYIQMYLDPEFLKRVRSSSDYAYF